MRPVASFLLVFGGVLSMGTTTADCNACDREYAPVTPAGQVTSQVIEVQSRFVLTGDDCTVGADQEFLDEIGGVPTTTLVVYCQRDGDFYQARIELGDLRDRESGELEPGAVVIGWRDRLDQDIQEVVDPAGEATIEIVRREGGPDMPGMRELYPFVTDDFSVTARVRVHLDGVDQDGPLDIPPASIELELWQDAWHYRDEDQRYVDPNDADQC